ncbi:MAG TPA: acyltransferase [Dyella sp.]|uniref:acyltransferase family protein n=1 Tax=Dyella sp. TaxID=1869338 RepID=UPI002BD7A9EB|nr:acyltransferase [Dyella sp.]HTV85454.1 acyltransferase [Dyella sp.]
MHRIPGLDLLRAVAILSVMCTHAWIAGGMGYGFGWIQDDGWMGVDLFFVLSGYLIGRQLLLRYQRTGKVDLKTFYRQRAYRILPAYLAMLALLFLIPTLREQAAMQPMWQFLTFTMNLLIDPSRLHTFSSAWSLCVEEHFYLVFPLMVTVMAPGASVKRVLAVLFGLMLAGLAWRGFAWWQSAAPSNDGSGVLDMNLRRYMALIYYPTYARLDGLLCGVGLAILNVYRPSLWQRLQRHANALALAGCVTVTVAAWLFQDILTFAACTVGFPILSFGLALLVAAAASPDGALARIRLPGIRWIATISYSLYLCHKAVLKLAWTHLPDALSHRGTLTFMCCALAAFAAAALLHYLVERPFLRLRDRGQWKATALRAREAGDAA